MISINGLTLGYGKCCLLRNASCEVPEAKLTALVGRNGAGKSTLLRAVAGLSKPSEGSISITGKDVTRMSPGERAQLVAVVTTERIRIPHLTCHQVVALGRTPYTGWAGSLSSADREAVNRALELTGMEAYATRTLNTMSDGECQRVMVARALAQDTPVILLDEPTSFLDVPSRRAIVALLRSLVAGQGKTVLYSTHELDLAIPTSDLLMLLNPPTLHIDTPSALAPVIDSIFSVGSQH